MTFPTIKHINDVLPSLAGRDEFVVGKRDGYQFIDYNYAKSDSFDDPMRRECRGLKFDLDGNLIARPLHKFFNLHEKPGEVPGDLSDAVIMEKLDGSMIHPAIVNGEVVFMTRAGITAQAKQAMEACKRLSYGAAVLEVCEDMKEAGFTPIFEFTSPHNQIVVRYKEDAITLLAMRFDETGNYWSPDMLSRFASYMGLPVVRTFDQSAADLEAFVKHARALKDTEGYVIRKGQWFGKLKADDYVAAHRAKSGLLWEKDVLRLVLEYKVDDVAALLPPDEAERLWRWSDKVWIGVSKEANDLDHVYGAMRRGSGDDRKAFASIANQAPPYQRSWLFSVLDGKAPREVIRASGLRHCASTTSARDYLNRLGVSEWSPVRLDSEA